MIELSLPDGDGTISKFEIDNSKPAHKNEDFMTGFAHMLLVSRKANDWGNDHELAMIQEAMKRNNVTCREAYNAFWEAYGDSFTPSSGIEWRHLWKHIQQIRQNCYIPLEEYQTSR